MPPFNESSNNFFAFNPAESIVPKQEFIPKNLDEFPVQTGYFAQQPRFGKSFAEKNYWSKEFSNVHNQFLGALGRIVKGWQQPGDRAEPGMRFEDWMREYDFESEYANLSPAVRAYRSGVSPTQFAPRTRFLYF
jgi:hypothetical protein|tara:strand:+ start:88 stop:489 length:402 start_codon:yes stop_codon:yes gene_type:complete